MQEATTEPVNLAEYLNAEKLSMKAILQLAQEVDDGLIEASPDDMKRLAERMSEKADAYYLRDEQLAADEDRLKKRIDMIAHGKARIARERKSLQNLLLWNMKAKNIEVIPGNEWVAKLKKGRGQLVALDQPTAADKAKHSDLVRVRYEWDKPAIKAAKLDDEMAKRFETNIPEKVKFEVKR